MPSITETGANGQDGWGTGVYGGDVNPVLPAGADGTAYHWTFTAKFDGKDNPVTGNSPFGDTVALTRVDSHTTRTIVKQGGKEVATQTTTVSADGKTRTTTTKGTDAKGQSIDAMSFYEKQ